MSIFLIYTYLNIISRESEASLAKMTHDHQTVDKHLSSLCCWISIPYIQTLRWGHLQSFVNSNCIHSTLLDLPSSSDAISKCVLQSYWTMIMLKMSELQNISAHIIRDVHEQIHWLTCQWSAQGIIPTPITILRVVILHFKYTYFWLLL